MKNLSKKLKAFALILLALALILPLNAQATEYIEKPKGITGYDSFYGVDLSAVYDYGYYSSHYPDVVAAYGYNSQKLLEHFVYYGMDEGRQGNSFFDVFSYKNAYPDLRAAFGTDLKGYYKHYITHGIYEGRILTTGVPYQIGEDLPVVLSPANTGDSTMLALANQNYDTGTGFLILVNKAGKKVEVYQGSRGMYTTIRSIPCAIGAAKSPTPTGTYFVGNKGLYFNTGTRGRCWYYTQIKGNYLFHSQIYDRQNKPVRLIDAAMSSEVSHGCIRLYLDDAKWIYDNIPRGTPIVVY